MHRILETFRTPRRAASLITTKDRQSPYQHQYDPQSRTDLRPVTPRDAGPDDGSWRSSADRVADADADADAQLLGEAPAADEGNTTLDFAPKARRTPFASSKRTASPPRRRSFFLSKTSSKASPSRTTPSETPSLATLDPTPAQPPETEADQEAVEATDDIPESNASNANNDVHAENDDKEEEEEEEDDDDDDRFEIKRLLSHRWAAPHSDSLEIQVQWATLETTWEPERILHADCPALLFSHWRSLPKGRPTNPLDPSLFELFAIRKHSPDRRRFLVEWVGYPPDEASWVPRQALEETDGDVITGYWDAVDKHRGKRGRGGRRRNA